MRVLITGSRTWPHDDTLLPIAVMNQYLAEYPTRELIFTVGDCPTGIDYIWREIVGEAEPDCLDVHEAHWDRYGANAGPIRNQAMVNTVPDIALAFSNGPIAISRGTWDCWRRAVKVGIPNYIIERYTGQGTPPKAYDGQGRKP